MSFRATATKRYSLLCDKNTINPVLMKKVLHHRIHNMSDKLRPMYDKIAQAFAEDVIQWKVEYMLNEAYCAGVYNAMTLFPKDSDEYKKIKELLNKS